VNINNIPCQQLENWFQNHRKKIGNVNGPAAGATMALVQRILKLSIPTCQRVHKHIEIFQMRNAGLIRDRLAEDGYNDIPSIGDDDDDWTDESQDMPEALKKRKKSVCMRMQTRVVQGMWAEALKEERKAVEQEVENEKKAMREEELRREADMKETKANTPWEMQE
jgi:hypothetical protein